MTNWEDAAEALKQELQTYLQNAATGETRAMEQFVTELSSDLIQATSIGREDLVEEIKGQVKVRAEALRIEATQITWTAVDFALQAVIKVVFAL